MADNWNDCPYGRKNDSYPGACSRYVDTDGNQICDRSEPHPSERNMEYSAETSVGLVNEVPQTQNYYFHAIYIPIVIYFLLWYLVNQTGVNKKIKWVDKTNLRLFWNVVLFIAFSISGISGLLFLIGPSKNLSNWHTYSGIVMVVLGFLHIFARLYYFKIFFRKSTKNGENSRL